MKPEKHLFVCANERPIGGKPSCGARGAGDVFAALQQAVGARPELWGRVAVTSSACLGPCFEGPNVVVYPDGVWYRGVQARDSAEIVREHLIEDRLVTRLVDDVLQ